MTVGVICFLVLLLVQVEKEAGESGRFIADYYVEIDLSYLWVFTVILLYALVASAWLLIASCRTTRGWYQCHLAPVTATGEEPTGEPISAIFCGTTSTLRRVQFHVFRDYFLFVHKRKLIAAVGAERYAEFNFARYLDNSLNLHLGAALQINATTWLLYIAIIAVAMVARLILYGSVATNDEITALTFIWPTMVIVAVIFLGMNVVARVFRLRLASSAHKLRDQVKQSEASKKDRAGAAYSNPMAQQQAALAESAEAAALEAATRSDSDQALDTVQEKCCLGCIDLRPCSKHSARAYWAEQCSLSNIFLHTSELLFLVQISSLSDALFDGFWQVFNAKPGMPFTEWWLATIFAASVIAVQLFVVLIVHPNVMANFVFFSSTTHLDAKALDATIEDMVSEQVAMDALINFVEAHLGGNWRQIYLMYDHSKTGTIGNKQLFDGLRASGVYLEYSQFCRLWRSINPNQDKYVTMEEFEQCFSAEIARRAQRVERTLAKAQVRIAMREKLDALAMHHGATASIRSNAQKRRQNRGTVDESGSSPRFTDPDRVDRDVDINSLQDLVLMSSSEDGSAAPLVKLPEFRMSPPVHAHEEQYAEQHEGQYAAQHEGQYAEQYEGQYAPQHEGHCEEQYEGQYAEHYDEHAQHVQYTEHAEHEESAPMFALDQLQVATAPNIDDHAAYAAEAPAEVVASSVSTTAAAEEIGGKVDVLSQVRANIAKRRRRSSLAAQALEKANPRATMG